MRRGSSLLALSALLAASVLPASAAPLRSARRTGYRPTPPKMDTALQREIAEHNAEVDRRKAEKRAAKRRAP